MPQYRVLTVNLGGTNYILIPFFFGDFQGKPDEDRLVLLKEFEECAAENGLSGTVAIIYPRSDGGAAFFPPGMNDLRDYTSRNSFDLIEKSARDVISCRF